MKRRCLGCMKEYEAEFDICPHCGYVYEMPAELEYHLQPGIMLMNRYQVGKVLGFGGFGITYIGWDMLLERRVAIKEYLPSGCATRTIEESTVTVFQGEKEQKFLLGLEKFEEEARRLAKFQEVDGIVQIYDVIRENNTAYIIMEYLEGESLKQRLKREGTVPVDETINLILPVLRSLQKVHDIGIIHRDIAADNIFLCKGEDGRVTAKLLDFGAARFVTTMQSHSLSVLVKMGYSPIEQYSSQGEQGPWTDVYAVAATMYRMITGENPQDSMERYAKDELQPISKKGVKIAKSTEAAIMNAMNLTPEYRTKDAASFVEELESEQVKRIHERIIRTDIGRWPKWLKITSASLAAVVCSFIILLVTGVIHFDIMGWGASQVPEGMTRVPNLINMQEKKAIRKADGCDLVFQILGKQYSNDIPEGKVLSQTLLGGSIVEKEETIGVIISAGVEKTYVPDVVNYMEDKAAEIISSANLTYSTTAESGDDAPGSIVSQDLEAGTEVDTGTNMNLVISLGRGFDASIITSVPNVVGQDYQNAKVLLLEECLYLVKSETVYSETIPENQIIEQTPAAGETINQDSVITVVVSAGRGTTRVPDVQYKTLDEAKILLENNNLTVQIEYEDSDTVAKDSVIRQSVTAGEEVKMGTVVTIYISNGNEKADNTLTVDDVVITQGVQEEADKQVEDTANQDTQPEDTKPEEEKTPTETKAEVPEVQGKDSKVAESDIKRAGFICIVTKAFSNTVGEGRVISQSVVAGTQMEIGSSVIIVVSKGPQAPEGWTTDGSFVDNKYYTYRTKTQYRKRTRTATEETTTSTTSNTKTGWTLYDTKQSWSDYGAWSAWSETPVAGSDSRQVKTKLEEYQVKTGTAYKYSHYKYWDSSTNNWGYTNMYYPNIGGEYEETVGAEKYLYTWYASIGAYGTTWAEGGWFNEEIVDIYEKRTKTLYCYRDRSLITTYHFKRTVYSDWSGWSAWQDAVVTANDTTQLEIRTVYYYTPK